MTKEEIVEMAKLSLWGGNVVEGWTFNSYEQLERFARLVAEHEREMCAVFAEESFCGCGRSSCIDGNLRAHNIAESIRARKDKND